MEREHWFGTTECLGRPFPLPASELALAAAGDPGTIAESELRYRVPDLALAWNRRGEGLQLWTESAADAPSGRRLLWAMRDNEGRATLGLESLSVGFLAAPGVAFFADATAIAVWSQIALPGSEA